VHDLLEHMYGSRNASSLRRSLHFYLTRRVLRKAARVIAVSQFTKNEIEKLLAIPDDRIEVVYNAIDERFCTATHRSGSRTDCPALSGELSVHSICGRDSAT